MQYSDVFVFFAVYGSELPPDEITERTGITPSETWRKGGRRLGLAMVMPDNGWIVESRLTRADTVTDQINDVMEQIGWEASKLLEIADGERMLCCALYMFDSDRPPGRIPERAVQVCALLRAGIDVDLYPMTDAK